MIQPDALFQEAIHILIQANPLIALYKLLPDLALNWIQGIWMFHFELCQQIFQAV